VHQAQQGLRDEIPEAPTAGPGDAVDIEALVTVNLIRRLDSEEDILALKQFHVWTLETMRKRFTYRQPGLWVLGVRVYRREPALRLLPTAEQLGCKSWVEFDAPFPTRGCRPVLDEDTSQERLQRLESALPREHGGTSKST
jgi:hypothetical protein